MRLLTKYGSILCSVLMLVGLTFGNPIPVGPEYDTLVDLLAHFPVSNVNSKSYIVKGRTAVGDGFEGLFYWVPNSTFATNNSTVFTWGNGRLFRMNVGSQPFTNITVINLTVISNLFLTNMTVFETNTVINQSFTTNIVDNSVTIYTNSVFQFNGTNIATINPTIGVVPYNGNGTNFFDSPIRVLNTNTVGVDQVFTYDFGVTNLVSGGFVVSIDSGLGYGLLTNVPFSAVSLWTNINHVYIPTDSSQIGLIANNVDSIQTLIAGGALMFSSYGTPQLTLGVNDLDNTALGYMLLYSTTATPTDTRIRLSTGNGVGQLLILQNATNNAFELLNGDTLWDDATSAVYLPGGDWKPTAKGESIMLLHNTQGWAEIGRFGGPTNVVTQELWQFAGGYLQPKPVTQPLLWTNSTTLGPGVLNFTNNGTGYGGHIKVGTAALSIFSDTSDLLMGNQAHTMSLSFAGQLLPEDTSMQLGGDGVPWNKAWLNTMYAYGFNSGGNYSRLAISHTGTNGVIMLSSQSAGSAGAARPFQIDRNLFASVTTGDATFVDLFAPTQTNAVTGDISWLYATNGITGTESTHTRMLRNGSGSDHTLTLPSTWHTNTASAIPATRIITITDGTRAKVFVSAIGGTSTAGEQDNVTVDVATYK